MANNALECAKIIAAKSHPAKSRAKMRAQNHAPTHVKNHVPNHVKNHAPIRVQNHRAKILVLIWLGKSKCGKISLDKIKTVHHSPKWAASAVVTAGRIAAATTVK